jgi:hypothetical protein
MAIEDFAGMPYVVVPPSIAHLVRKQLEGSGYAVIVNTPLETEFKEPSMVAEQQEQDRHHPTAAELAAAEKLAALTRLGNHINGGGDGVTPRPAVIVGECSKTYQIGADPGVLSNPYGVPSLERYVGQPDLIATRFEILISENERRGYRLRDWRFTSVPCGVQVGHTAMTDKVCETIVAIFDRVDASR